jgi:hypothetical protein
MKRYTITIIVLAVALLLPGCFTSNPGPQKGVSAGSAVDSFCISAKKRTWDLTDSAEAIMEAEIWNGAIDRRCGARKRKS